MTNLTHPSIPAVLRWRNDPSHWNLDGQSRLSISAPGKTDLFSDPAGAAPVDNSPCALFAPPDGQFLLSARVSVEFASTYDAGVLQLRGGDDAWAKLCFERSPQRQPMIVSVVTRGLSDDCNSTIIDGTEVYLRIAHTPRATAFHYSLDGRLWHFVRYFSLGAIAAPQVGFSSQSPTGNGCRAVFSEIHYSALALKDNRSGE
jgi:hypothetical protein